MNPIKVDPQIMSGTPCFSGTRVPIKTLFDYAKHGHPLERFLDHFPSVHREQAVEVLDLAGETLLAGYPTPRRAVGGAAMKVLLDECLPHPLRHHIPNHDVYTVAYLGWVGIQNGRLLDLAATEGFDALVTTDQNVEFQQNLTALRLAILVLDAPSNDLADLLPLVPALLEVLSASPALTVIHVR